MALNRLIQRNITKILHEAIAVIAFLGSTPIIGFKVEPHVLHAGLDPPPNANDLLLITLFFSDLEFKEDPNCPESESEDRCLEQ